MAKGMNFQHYKTHTFHNAKPDLAYGIFFVGN